MAHPLRIWVEFDDPVGPESIAVILDYIFDRHMIGLAACINVTDEIKRQVWGQHYPLDKDQLKMVEENGSGCQRWGMKDEIHFRLSPWSTLEWSCWVTAAETGARVCLEAHSQFPYLDGRCLDDEDETNATMRSSVPTFDRHKADWRSLRPKEISIGEAFDSIDGFLRALSEVRWREDSPEWQLHRKLLAFMLAHLVTLYRCTRASISDHSFGEYHLFHVDRRV